MNKLPIVIATSIVRTSGLNEPHGFLYVVDLKTKKVTRTIEWNDPEIDFAGRGRQQGLRGIAFYNDKIYIGTGFKILEFSKDFDLLASYQNQYLIDIHEMIVVENQLLVVSSGYDAVIYFDLNTKLFTKAYAVDVKDFSFKKNLFYRFFNKYAPYWLSLNKSIENYPLYVFDPETPNQIKGTSFKPHRIHFNTVSMSKSGMCVSGTLSNYQFLITKEEISKYATIPLVTHNVLNFENDTILYNSTAKEEVVWSHRTGWVIKRFKNPTPDPIKLQNMPTDSKLAKVGWARGLCWTSDFKYIISGTSPASIMVYEKETGKLLRHIILSYDVRNAIHGLEIFPF